MKRIVVCCDGTWNSPERGNPPTNVIKLARAVPPEAPGNVTQVVYYDPGVGTGNFFDRITGGAFGVGLGRNVRDAYRFLVHNYSEGDEIYLFGFSRGAFTARSIAGFIRNAGLLHKTYSDLTMQAWRLYRKRDPSADTDEAQRFREAYSRPPLRIRLIGVWDTVGSLGIPGLLNFIGRKRFAFHDVALSRSVDHAYHAVAIDEKRRFFKPTLWEQHPDAGEQVLEQAWFAGVHADIGGGYPDGGLSDNSLAWMVTRAQRAGLYFDAEYLDSSCTADPLGDLHESHWGPYKLIPAHHRPIGEGVPADEAAYTPPGPSRECLHDSARQRHGEDAGYRPPRLVEYLVNE